MATSYIFDIDGNIDDQTQRVVLDNKTYEFRFQYNYRDDSWNCFISPVGGEAYCSFKLTSFNEFLAPYKYNENIPQGELHAAPINNPRTRITRYNVGPSKGVELWYNSPDE